MKNASWIVFLIFSFAISDLSAQDSIRYEPIFEKGERVFQLGVYPNLLIPNWNRKLRYGNEQISVQGNVRVSKRLNLSLQFDKGLKVFSSDEYNDVANETISGLSGTSTDLYYNSNYDDQASFLNYRTSFRASFDFIYNDGARAYIYLGGGAGQHERLNEKYIVYGENQGGGFLGSVFYMNYMEINRNWVIEKFNSFDAGLGVEVKIIEQLSARLELQYYRVKFYPESSYSVTEIDINTGSRKTNFIPDSGKHVVLYRLHFGTGFFYNFIKK